MVITLKREYSGYFRDLRYEKAPGTVDAYTYTIKKYLSFLNRKEPSLETAREFLDTFKEDGNGPRSIARHNTALRHFFVWLNKPEVALKLKNPYMEEPLPPFITDEEFDILISNTSSFKIKAALALTFGAGLRLSEACNIEVKNIDEGGFIKVMGKGGKERFIPVEDEVIDMLKPWKDYVSLYSKYMFPGQDPRGPQRKNGFQALLRNHMRRCGIKGKSVHSLRHGGATSLYNRGSDLKEIQEFLGHKKLATTVLYAHLTPERLRKRIIGVGRFKNR